MDSELSASYINSLGSIWVFLAPSLAPHGVFPGLLGQSISVTYNLWRQIGDKMSWPWKHFFASKIVLRVIVCCLRCSIRRRRKETSSKHKLAGGLFKMADLKPSMQCKPNPTFPPLPLKGKLCKYNKRTTRGIITTNQNVHVKHWGHTQFNVELKIQAFWRPHSSSWPSCQGCGAWTSWRYALFECCS